MMIFLFIVFSLFFLFIFLNKISTAFLLILLWGNTIFVNLGSKDSVIDDSSPEIIDISSGIFILFLDNIFIVPIAIKSFPQKIPSTFNFFLRICFVTVVPMLTVKSISLPKKTSLSSNKLYSSKAFL